MPVYRQVIDTGEPVLQRELTAERPGTGRVRHVLASWFPVRVDGEVTGVGVVVVDITARKAAEMRLQGVLQQLPVGVVIAERRRHGAARQRAARDDRARAVSRRPGRTCCVRSFDGRRADGTAFGPDQLPLRRVAAAPAQVARGVEVTFAREDGAQRTVEVNAAPIRDGDEIVAAVAVYRTSPSGGSPRSARSCSCAPARCSTPRSASTSGSTASRACSSRSSPTS